MPVAGGSEQSIRVALGENCSREGVGVGGSLERPFFRTPRPPGVELSCQAISRPTGRVGPVRDQKNENLQMASRGVRNVTTCPPFDENPFSKFLPRNGQTLGP